MRAIHTPITSEMKSGVAVSTATHTTSLIQIARVIGIYIKLVTIRKTLTLDQYYCPNSHIHQATLPISLGADTNMTDSDHTIVHVDGIPGLHLSHMPSELTTRVQNRILNKAMQKSLFRLYRSIPISTKYGQRLVKLLPHYSF